MDHNIGSTGITSAADWILIMQRSENGKATMLCSEGKKGAASAFSLEKKNGIFFEINGLERDRLIQLKTAQNEIFECIKESKRTNWYLQNRSTFVVIDSAEVDPLNDYPVC